MSAAPPTVAVVLAAGQGKRMRSATPKVLHRVAGRPLLGWVLEAARAAGCERILCVVGHGAEQVREALTATDVEFVLQAERRGTGHALAQARDAVGGDARLLVLSGDVPLLTPQTLERLAAAAAEGWGAMAVARLDEPGSLGRVLARPGSDGETAVLDRIVEFADADAEALAVRTINAGIYALPAPAIFERIDALEPDNAQGEIYLTDALSAAAAAGETVRLVRLREPSEALGVNDRGDLVRVRRVFQRRKSAALLAAGVTLWEPRRTVVEPDVEVGRDTEIEPDVTLLGATRVGEGCRLGQGAWVRDSEIAAGAVIEPYSVLDRAVVGEGARGGPYARLRPGAVLGRGAKVGNYVELKNTTLGDGAKAGHLAYLGDAEVGAGANIGAGTVTCNYDGVEKHATRIGADAFVGSDTMLVAPVEVGRDATIGAGSVITNDVPPGALAVERSRQRNIPGWAERRPRKKD